MDKIKINNQVILMRKVVKQAKLYTINKLTKQIKCLRSKKGIEDQKLKNERKIKRLLEKIAILKKMIPDTVSRMALSKAKDWTAILAQKETPLEEHCLAILASHTEVQKEVEKFHSVEKHLVPKIPELFLEWEVKNQSSDKKSDRNLKASDIKRKKLEKISKRKMLKFRGASFPNNITVTKKSNESFDKSESYQSKTNASNGKKLTENMESTEDNAVGILPDIENTDFKVTNKKAAGNMRNESEGEENLNEKNHLRNNIIQQSKRTSNEVDTLNKTEHSEKTQKFSNRFIQDSKIAQQTISNEFPDRNQSIFEKLNAIACSDLSANDSKNNISKRNSKFTKAITELDLNLVQNFEEIPIQSPDLSDTESNNVSTTSKKDPFFLTGEESDDSRKNDDSPKKRLPNVKNFTGEHRQKMFRGNNFKNNSFRDRKIRDKRTSPNEKCFWQENKRNSQLITTKKSYDRESKFPQRKEIKTFTSNNNSSNFVKNSKNNKVKNNFQKKDHLLESNKEVVNLHPSWEAKRKLKDSLKSGTKGKRVVFDD